MVTWDQHNAKTEDVSIQQPAGTVRWKLFPYNHPIFSHNNPIIIQDSPIISHSFSQFRLKNPRIPQVRRHPLRNPSQGHTRHTRNSWTSNAVSVHSLCQVPFEGLYDHLWPISWSVPFQISKYGWIHKSLNINSKKKQFPWWWNPSVSMGFIPMTDGAKRHERLCRGHPW
jgi:hypothetical protein